MKYEAGLHVSKRSGNARTVDVREVVNGLLYVLGTGCQWRAIPKDLPPRSTLHGYLMRWEWNGTLARIHHELHLLCREQAGREPSPTAAIIDSQSVKGAVRGAFDRPARIRSRQEDQGQEDAPSGRHARPDAARRGAQRRSARP